MQITKIPALLTITIALTLFASAGLCDGKTRGLANGGGALPSGYTPEWITPTSSANYEGLRRAPGGQSNIIALVGGSDDSSPEYQYARDLAQRTGGAFFHGNYTPQDLAAYMASQGPDNQIANVYFVGHSATIAPGDQQGITDTQRLTGVAPNGNNQFVFLQMGAGGDQVAHLANANNNFVGALDQQLAAQGRSYNDIFAPNANVVFRACDSTDLSGSMLGDLQNRLHDGATITTYDTAFTWATANPLQRLVGASSYVRDESSAGTVRRAHGNLGDGQNFTPPAPARPQAAADKADPDGTALADASELNPEAPKTTGKLDEVAKVDEARPAADDTAEAPKTAVAANTEESPVSPAAVLEEPTAVVSEDPAPADPSV